MNALLARRDALFSLALAVFAFFPSIAAHGTTGAFLFTADSLAWYTPTLAKAHALLSQGHFVALDFTAYNGGGDFFLTPIFPYFNPLVVAYGLLAPASWATVEGLLAATVAFDVAHVFVACYFTLKLLQQQVGMRFAAAAIGATLFACGMPMLFATTQLSFLMCAAFMPWVAHAASRMAMQPSMARASRASLPVLFCLLGGYLPLAAFCLAVSAFLVAALVLCDEAPAPVRVRARRLAWAAVPFAIASAVALPLLLGIHGYHADSLTSLHKTVDWVAHDRSELPQTLVRMLTTSFTVVGRNFELYTGVPALAVAALYLFVPGARRALRPLQERLLWACAALWLVIVLATFGNYTVVSDLFYYFLPQVGQMHNYSRFLLPGQLLLAASVALMCQALLAVRPRRAGSVLAAMAFVATLAAAYALVNQSLVIELLLAALLGVALLAPGRHTLAIVAWIALAAPALDRFHEAGTREHALPAQRVAKPLVLDAALHEELGAWLQRTFPGRTELRYLDATHIWLPTMPPVEWFPKNFPGVVIGRVRLTSYNGYPNHILARRDYARKMPLEGFDGFGGDASGRVAPFFAPSWELVDDSGAAFFVAREEDVRSGSLGGVLAEDFARAAPDAILRLPNGVVAAPLRPLPPAGVLYENAPFRVVAATAAAAPVNVARGKPAAQSGTGGGPADRAVDGVTDGDFAARSVTHTDADADAWLEVDLGEAMPIDRVRIWNRTDCCGDRLQDYWVFVSPTPFSPRDRAADLRARAGVWGRPGWRPRPVADIRVGGAQGRYVRIQLGGRAAPADRFLSVAELEVFRADASAAAARPAFRVESASFNFANRASLAFEASAPVELQYRYAFNPHLVFTLDGQRVEPANAGELLAVRAGPGRHTLEVRYRNWTLVAFWALFALLLAAALASAIGERRSRRAAGRQD